MGVPYQPDAEPDGLIGASDLLSLLGLFGTVIRPMRSRWTGALATAWQDECEEEEAYSTSTERRMGRWPSSTASGICWRTMRSTVPSFRHGSGLPQFDSLAVIDDGTALRGLDCVADVRWIHVCGGRDRGPMLVVENSHGGHANGDSIPGSLSGAEWSSRRGLGDLRRRQQLASTPARMDACDEVAALAAYGRQYNWPGRMTRADCA